ncbi:hypothetical protein ACH47Z_25510 [Streptomyces sp. NPDC020192]|uniref:hypothetical protein n=1 Tax=Streptomyces sp. NPDC020192 TaxID=3365066 RepID=UPI003799431F
MPVLPWTVPAVVLRDAEVYVFASRFETRTLWGALRFLARAAAARGARVTLKAFAHSGPHRPTSRALAAHIRDVFFAT